MVGMDAASGIAELDSRGNAASDSVTNEEEKKYH